MQIKHNDIIDWLYDKNKYNFQDKDLRRFQMYFHRTFYNIPFFLIILNQYTNNLNTYVKPKEYFDFLKYIIKKNKIPRNKLTSVFPKRKKN